MEYLVKSNSRWDSGSFYRTMSFDDIINLFFGGDYDEELDQMMDGIVKLNVGQSYSHDFFMNDVYTFERIA
jgi:hypothetical protein